MEERIAKLKDTTASFHNRQFQSGSSVDKTAKVDCHRLLNDKFIFHTSLKTLIYPIFSNYMCCIHTQTHICTHTHTHTHTFFPLCCMKWNCPLSQPSSPLCHITTTILISICCQQLIQVLHKHYFCLQNCE